MKSSFATVVSAAPSTTAALPSSWPATPYGGGVAEILRSEVPVLRDLGLSADWQLVRGDEAFFRVTKAIHNGL